MTRAGGAVVAAAAAALAAGCGGGRAPAKPAEPPRTTRIAIEDSEPDDGVEVISSRGHMEPEVVEAGIAPHKLALSACYTSRIGRRRWLGGRVELRWDITRTGEVTQVVLAASDLGAWPIEKCMLEVARMAEFGRPVGGDADFVVPLELAARGQLAIWDADQSERAVGDQLTRLDACARGNVRAPEQVTITLYAGPRGAPQSVGFASPSPIDEAWAACAEKAALAWKLPDPRGTITKLAVRYR